MNHMRLITISLLTILSLGACGKNEAPPTATGSSTATELLSHVPADTPYLFANLEPVPEDVLDTFLTRLQPVLDSMQSQLSMVRSEMESAEEGYEGDPGARFAHAGFQKKKITTTGWPGSLLPQG